MGANADKLEAVGIEALCDMVIEGMMLREVARKVGAPIMSMMDWIEADPARKARMRQARERSAQLWEEKAEQLLSDADEPFMLSRAKELAHHYRWRASKIAPRSYGDKVELRGSEDAPLVVKAIERVVIDPKAPE